jgi:hypothetical protein
MSEHGPSRAWLDRQAVAISPEPVFERLRTALDVDACLTPPVTLPAARPSFWRRLRLGRKLAWTAAAAAAMLLAFVGGQHLGPARAAPSPEAVVREARTVHSQPIDRCYLAEHRLFGDTADRHYPLLGQPRINRLWTRGDRFWIESTSGRTDWAWGRDEAGNVWMALSRHRGVLYEPLAISCDLYSMRLETLLDTVLRDFDLRPESPPPGAPTGSHFIRAELKPGRQPPGLRSVRLEVDPETKVLRQVVLHRVLRDRHSATVTFTLVETRAQDDALYQLEGRLAAPYDIYTRTNQPQRRREMLVRLFGPRFGDLPRVPPPEKS